MNKKRVTAAVKTKRVIVAPFTRAHRQRQRRIANLWRPGPRETATVAKQPDSRLFSSGRARSSNPIRTTAKIVPLLSQKLQAITSKWFSQQAKLLEVWTRRALCTNRIAKCKVAGCRAVTNLVRAGTEELISALTWDNLTAFAGARGTGLPSGLRFRAAGATGWSMNPRQRAASPSLVSHDLRMSLRGRIMEEVVPRHSSPPGSIAPCSNSCC